MIDLILASGSPRRQVLLEGAGFELLVRPSNADEAVVVGETPTEHVLRLAQEKSRAVRAASVEELPVVGADTTIVFEGRSIGKPADERDAQATLAMLSGRAHDVVTAVAVLHPGREPATVTVGTTVELRDLSAAEIEWYVATGEPLDKAGSYGIQGLGGAFVARLRGSYSNVMGLPLAETIELLGQL